MRNLLTQLVRQKFLIEGFFFIVMSSCVFAEQSETILPPSSLTIQEQGARHGQAIAATLFCPGAKLTKKAEKLSASLNTSQKTVFTQNSEKIRTDWMKAFNCTDVDPAQTREINGCRRAKILSCTMTWQEIGPQGTALQGLLEFQP